MTAQQLEYITWKLLDKHRMTGFTIARVDVEPWGFEVRIAAIPPDCAEDTFLYVRSAFPRDTDVLRASLHVQDACLALRAGAYNEPAPRAT